MDMKGEFRIPVGQDAVWLALNDPEILKASIPGCEELVRESETSFSGKVFASVGPVKARFGGQATLSDIDPPTGYTLTGNGSGGPAGMAKGSAVVRLKAEGGETVLTYEVKAQVAGKLAQIGARLIDMTAKKMADEFFGNFAKAVGAKAVRGEAMPVAAVPPTETVPKEVAVEPSPGAAESLAEKSISPQRSSWLVWPRLGWVAVAVVAILLIALMLTR